MLSDPGVHSVWLFVVSSLLLNLTPGTDTAYVVSRAVADGWSAGVVSAIGISCGSAVHCFLAAFGLSGVLVSEPRVFLTGPLCLDKLC